ncbi:DUF6415 family natural product biosynthesis protein [Streptomyces sp. GESEQ-4]|uniref:DUF6415 family natural product biosynthesis protein n=1 Tax=Streptomyces sp. GESEQ-4 TaxID=2812655 RepID=UPI001B31E37E|nr:DUF6415 family natural product biosynthesis protein [Streptomyces sp. GESEQ-4]
MNATHADTNAPTLNTTEMRATAYDFLGAQAPPRYETIQRLGHDFRRDLWELIPRIEQLTAPLLHEDDVPAKVALAGVGEAHRRLDEIERAGLLGEFERVKRLARSVLALCDHYATLTGIAMCLVCDKPIEDDEESVPYDHGSPLGEATRAGRVHTTCANTVRRH